MTSKIALTRLAVLSALIAVLGGCGGATRPEAPPSGALARVPDGAIDARIDSTTASSEFGRELSTALDSRFSGEFERDSRGRAVFRVLALSGGGSESSLNADPSAEFTPSLWDWRGQRPRRILPSMRRPREAREVTKAIVAPLYTPACPRGPAHRCRHCADFAP